MKQKTNQKIFKIIFIISIVGIFLLLIIPEFSSIKITKIGDLNQKMLNEKVKISGELIIIRNKEGFKILTIQEETEKIDIICNCEEIKNYQNVTVTGTLEEYEGQMQIRANKITRA